MLLLVALVTVLVVGTSMLARVERGAVSNEANTEVARQNALFGLNVALAQLQKTAGRDQRVTARADILDTNPNTSQVDGIRQPYWTGVWQTGKLPLDTDVDNTGGGSLQRPTSFGVPSAVPAPTPTTAQKVASATWLVSTPINTSVNPAQPYKLDPTIDPASYPSYVKLVTLAKNLPDPSQATPTTAARINVKAPLVSVYPSATTAAAPSSTPSGKYAYWVSDEGIKAKPNTVDPTYGIAPSGTVPTGSNSNFVQNQLHFLGPQAVASQTGLFGASNTTDVRNASFAADLLKVSSLQSLGYVGGNTPAITGLSGTGAALFSPDATTYSYGVLADVRNGGLKTDLSQALEDPNQFSTFLGGLSAAQPTQLSGDQKVWLINARSFDAGNSMTATDFGPRWQGLYNYYSLYKSAGPNTVQSSGTVAGCPWRNFNYYSGPSPGVGGNPGTNTPQMDMRVFNYTSNALGNGGANLSTQELGESYAPRIMGFAVYLSMTSTQNGPGTTPGTHMYNLVQYAQPRLVLYNPYNVTVNPPVPPGGSGSPVPYIQQITTNAFGRSLTVSVGNQVVQNSKPITWTGTFNPDGSAKAMDLSMKTAGVMMNTFKPGELRVVGLATTTAVTTAGNQLNFPKLVDGIGQAQYMALLPDTGGSTPWSALCNDNDHVMITYPSSQKIGSNNGFYSYSAASGSPIYWPLSSNSQSSNLAGRFFYASKNSDPLTTVDLGPISGLAAPAGTISSAKTFGYIVLRTKGLKQSSTASGTLVPQPTFSSCDGEFSPLPMYLDAPMSDVTINLTASNPTSNNEMNVTVGTGSPPSPPFDTYWGGSDVGVDPNDPSLLPLRDVPRQPLLSLGQFMHMATRNSTAPNPNSIDTNTAMMCVGGSYADPYFALNRVNNDTASAGASAVAYFDDNFLMNQGLFDTYYFSSVPLPATSMDAAYKQVLPAMTNGTTAFTDANITTGTCVLPNSRMSFYAKNGVAPQATSSNKANYVSDYRKSSANLLLNGAFNVNSTSVNAWGALLSSLSGNSVSYLNPATGTFAPISANSLLNPIFRFPSPVSVSYPVTTSAAPSFWGGINALSNAQVTALAQEIVKQVKLRGPFLSMADFLNRRLDATNTALGLKGALQAAIDNTSINDALKLQYPTPIGIGTPSGRANTPPTVIAAQLPSPGTTAIGVPGWLMQQDLVQCFSPTMTVRSDTFVVRCYGESDNVRNGATVGRVWGEAVVQRLPDFVDQNDSALSAGTNLGDATPLANVSATNQTLGRRFKVVSFRWLNESDL